MRLTSLLSLCFLLGTSLVAHSQDTIRLQTVSFNQISIFSLMGGGSKGYLYKIGQSDFQPIGYGVENLKPFLTSQPKAFEEWKRYKRGTTMMWVGGAAAFTSFILWSLETDGEHLISDSPAFRYSMLGVTATGFSVSLIFSRKANRHFRRSVAEYNHAVLGRR